MIIFPAIDIIGGDCVRLFKGEYGTVHKVADSPLVAARSFHDADASWVHVVDLDAAKAGEPCNFDVVKQLIDESGLQVEIGGGVRTMQTVERYVEAGAARVILGSVACRDPDFVKEAVGVYGDKIAVGIDARDRKVAVSGWVETSELDFIELAHRMEDVGVKLLIFTDIARDGTLRGPNLSQLDELNGAVLCDITASGGVGTMADLEQLYELGLYGAICGKAVYTGDVSLQQAIRKYE